MTTPLTTVNVTPMITLLYGARGGLAQQMQLINNSTSITIWIGYDQTIAAGSGPVIPLLPGASIAMDGTRSVYGITSSGTASMSIVPGGSSYSPGVNIASLFSLSGTQVIPGNSTVMPVSLINIGSYSSYDFSFQLLDALQATVGHSLAFQVDLTWYDDLISGVPIFKETWYPWVVQNNSLGGIVATGPMHGQYMSIAITNGNASPITLMYANLFGSFRNGQLSDWRQNVSNLNIHDAVLFAFNDIGNGFDNTLYDSGIQLGTAVSRQYLLPWNLYTGPAYLACNMTAAPTHITTVDIGTNYKTQTSGNVQQTTGTLDNEDAHMPAGSGFLSNTLLTPRSAVATILVGQTAGAASLSFIAIAQQGP